MKLWALSDLHLNATANRETVAQITPRPDDWLALIGDLGEQLAHLAWAFETLGPKFKQLLWTPGNHELWSGATEHDQQRGVARYEALLQVCRDYGVLTPEDPFPLWPGEGPPTRICPLFLLYDYSFCPDGLNPEQAIAWAKDNGIVCGDERFLPFDPYPDRQSWGRARTAYSAARLDAIPATERTVLLSHWPLRQDTIRLFRIPAFSPWCGSTLTESWHLQYRATVVATGHLHMRATDWRGGTRFEEVSLGVPKHYLPETGAEGYLRELLPGPPPPPDSAFSGPIWHR